MCNLVFLMVLCFVSQTWAKAIVDIHGLQGVLAQRLLQEYAPKIEVIETELMHLLLQMNQGPSPMRRYRCLIGRKKRLIKSIRDQGKFGFVDLQTVYYPNDNNSYTTLEIVDHPRSKRMRYVSLISQNRFLGLLNTIRNQMMALYQRDLIAKMLQYQTWVMQLLLTHQLDNDSEECPVYHCIASFHDPRLQPYLTVFQRGAITEKLMIINTLRQDKNPRRRSAAALLVGHFQDPKEIISLLSMGVEDSDSEVRNNVLRVMATTLYKAHLSQMDSGPFIRLLDSPYVTDRNKALSILIMLAEDPNAQAQILQQGGAHLVDLLRLTQPDNHDLAYTLLRKVSHQNFGELQFEKWSKWVGAYQGRKNNAL